MDAIMSTTGTIGWYFQFATFYIYDKLTYFGFWPNHVGGGVALELGCVASLGFANDSRSHQGHSAWQAEFYATDSRRILSSYDEATWFVAGELQNYLDAHGWRPQMPFFYTPRRWPEAGRDIYLLRGRMDAPDDSRPFRLIEGSLSEDRRHWNVTIDGKAKREGIYRYSTWCEIGTE